MSKRVLSIVLLSLSVLVAGIVTKSAYGGSIPVNWRVTGVGVQAEIATSIPGITAPGIFGDLVLKGAPGYATGKFAGTISGMVEPPNLECGDFPMLLLDEVGVVFTFADQSMLFATKNPDPNKISFHCITPPPQLDMTHMIIIGGTGRYEDASGELTGTYYVQPITGALGAETGTIEGWIDR